MVERDAEMLTEAEAAQLWARAAELQAASGETSEGIDALDRPLPPPGYALAHVRAAAVEAGIGSRYLDAALADLRAEQALPARKRAGGYARRFLDNPPDAIVVRRRVKATPQEVLESMEAVFPGEPYRLSLMNQPGAPQHEGMLIFELPSPDKPMVNGFAFSMYDSGIHQLIVSVWSVDGPAPSSELTIRGPLSTHNLSAGMGTVLATITGAVGVGVSLAGGLGLETLRLAPGILPIVATVGAVAGGSLGVKAFRAMYRASMRGAHAALDRLCGAVAIRAEGGWQALSPRKPHERRRSS